MISVIVPVYNAEKYIDKCIESILVQTYTEFEVLLINDGSQDTSGVKCDEWATKDTRIRVIHQSNLGLSATRNVGLSLAKGDYIAWVDSDDYIAERYLECLYHTMKESNADMVLCGFYTDIEGTITHEGKEYFSSAIYTTQEFLERVYTYGMYSVIWNKFAPKKAYNNISFPEGRIFEDSSVMRELASVCSKIVVIGEPLYYYRRHAGSITLREKDAQEQLKYMKQFCKWLQDDIAVYEKQHNGKLLAFASKHMCDAIIMYSDKLDERGKKEAKKIYRTYVKNILNSKDMAGRTKLKYFVARIHFALYRALFNLVQSEKRI